jgi:hypothetical protein
MSIPMAALMIYAGASRVSAQPYGGFTGGGTTVVVSDSDCSGSDDTSTVQTRLNSLASNGTLDFQNTTHPCDINSNGLSRGTLTNVRITSSVTAPSGGHIRGIATGLYSTAYSSIFYVAYCVDCLVDKLIINANSTQGQGIFLHHTSNSSIQNNEVYDIAVGPTNVPYAAIKCDDCEDIWVAENSVHDTGGTSSGAGVRGIWVGVGGEYSVRPRIFDNIVSNTGHTGIVTESQNPLVTGNSVTTVTVQGTGYKFIPRGFQAEATFDYNSADTTLDACFQFEPSGVTGSNTYIRHNDFSNCGGSGTSFGGLYLSGATGGGSQNIVFTDNTLTSCRSVGALNNAHTVLLQDNTLVTPVSPDGGNVILENDDTDITVNNSGTIVMQGGCTGTCSNIFQDGTQLASLPMRSNGARIFARIYIPQTFEAIPGPPAEAPLE